MEQERASTPVGERVDPVHGFAGRVLVALDRVADAPGWALTPAEQAEALVELARVEARLVELRWRVLAAADRTDLAAVDGSVSTAAWLAARTLENRSRTNAELRGALLLEKDIYAPTRVAFAAGALTVDQVWVILRAVEDLPAGEVTEDQRAAAQAHLIELARTYDAKRLRVLARRLFEVLAPEEADRREGEALEAEERRARERCRFAMRENGDGTTSGWFKLPTVQAEMLGKAVQAFAAPRRNPAAATGHHGGGHHGVGPEAGDEGEGRRLSYPVLLGQAFCDLVEHLPTQALPQAGGVAASVVVTLGLDALATGLGAGTLDTGSRISAGQARRLACTAGLIPAVLGGGSVPLDLGRRRRLHTEPQRVAMAIRDRGCTATGCDRPPAWCEAHHEQPWSTGGSTSVTGGRLLCPHHHRLAHDTRYDTHRLPDGSLRFSRRI